MSKLTAESFWEKARGVGLLSEGDFIVAAVSGGADSSALLRLLWSLREEKKLTLLCAHVNHNLRGKESERDENFVRELCEKYGIPIKILSADVSGFALEHGLSTEEAGRKIRYEFFEHCARELSPGAKIATAHSLSDSIETFIFNAARGTGLSGLCGIPPRRGKIVRPLLGFSRGEIEDYCARNEVPFVTDSTNLADEYTRNKIRHRVVPVLREINPDFESAFSRLFGSLREISDDADLAAAAALGAASLPQGLDARALRALAPPLKKRAAALVLGRFGFGVSAERVNFLSDAFGGGDFKAELAKNAYLVQRDGIIFREEKKEPLPPIEERELSPGKIPLSGGKTAEIELLPYEKFKNLHKVNHYDLKYTFDYGKILGTAVVRSRREGDKMNLTGGTKTLKKLFIEKKIPAEERNSLMVIADGEGVLWAEGLGAARRARLSGETKTVAAVKIRRNENINEKDAAK